MNRQLKNLFVALFIVSVSVLSLTRSYAESSVWPVKVKEIKYMTSADFSMQPALYFSPDGKKKIPLLVVLHTWSADYMQAESIPFAQWCIEKEWAFIHPNFRGPNKNKEATCSELAIRDIISAVDYAQKNADIDPNRIYLTGWSGGGCASLMAAGRFPDIWAGVSVWVPVTNLNAWYWECKASNSHYSHYANDIVASCGGVPGESLAIDFEYRSRSPLTFIKNLDQVPLDINVGIKDDIIPISHSLNAYNLLALENDRISKEDINYLSKNKSIPCHFKESLQDPLYKSKTPLFRKTSACVRITIFDGGHERIPEAALYWLEKQHKSQ